MVSNPVLYSWGPRYILIQTEELCGFPQSLQTYAGIVPLHYAVILPHLQLLVHSSLALSDELSNKEKLYMNVSLDISWNGGMKILFLVSTFVVPARSINHLLTMKKIISKMFTKE
jgi:hypothetical protein